MRKCLTIIKNEIVVGSITVKQGIITTLNYIYIQQLYDNHVIDILMVYV